MLRPTLSLLLAASACVALLACSANVTPGPGTGGDGGSGGAGGGAGGGQGGAGPGTGGSGTGGSDLCGLPMEVGNCLAAFPRFWFDASTGDCLAFIYGGCEGNANNFESLGECFASCAPANESPCESAVCPPSESCVYVEVNKPICAEPCPVDTMCPVDSTCGCGASCPGCKDCTSVCVPDA